MKLDFDITTAEYTVIRDILARLLPPDANVWVFGSRAKGTARFNSDLDLAIEGKTVIAQSQVYALKEAFNDAPLSFRVDIVDLADVDAGFRKIIEQHRVSFPMPMAKQNHLRFPEFEGEWCVKALGPFIEEFREVSTEQDQFEVLTSARSGLLKQKDYYDNDRNTDRDNIGFNIVPPGYLTYRSRSDDRRFFFNENNLGITGIISVYYPVFRIVEGDNKFFIELLSRHINTIGKFSVGTSQTVLSMNELKKIKLPLPSQIGRAHV